MVYADHNQISIPGNKIQSPKLHRRNTKRNKEIASKRVIL